MAGWIYLPRGAKRKGGFLMRSFYERNQKTIHDLILLTAAILVCFLFFRYLFPIFLPFLIGWLLSLLFCPLADRLERRGVPRGVGALLGILLLFGLFGALGVWSGTGLTQRLRLAFENLPQYMEYAENALASFWEHFDAFLAQLPPQLRPFLQQFEQEFSNILFALLNQGAPASLFSAVPHFFLGFFVALVSAYFFTKDKAAIHQAYLAHLEPLVGFSLGAARKELAASVWGYLKTQLILMLVTFCICIAGMLALRSPHPLLLSALTAVIDALPFFGSGFILWPGAAIHLIMGHSGLAIGYLVIYGIIQATRQIMQPRILSAQIGLHPLLTLFSMYFGFRCIGVWGLLLGPVVAVVLQAFFRLRNAG